MLNANLWEQAHVFLLLCFGLEWNQPTITVAVYWLIVQDMDDRW
jgi:hypothetical protein